MQLTEELIKKIEIQYLHLVLALARSNKVTRSVIKSSAQLMITYAPFKDEHDIKMKLSNFKEIFPPFAPLYTYLLQELEKEKTKDVLEKMRHLIKKDDIDSALQLTDNK